ncbi:ABC transporter permease [Sciscionella sediminilitoris]|uniref:ABC transporter permease n=1 Tax=Sciscionella sediminilitoris TaxID=1445613 RepID=UPI0004DF4815|nr:ABC transporter permease [Sciscionella sp. SE31]
MSLAAAGKYLRPGQVKVGLVLLALMLLFTFLGPLFAPHQPNGIIGTPYAEPGNGLTFGADTVGRDVLSRVLWGGYQLVWMSVLAALLGVAVGAGIGLLAAFRGGILETLLMRLMDVLLAFPGVLLALLFVSMLGPSKPLLVLLVAVGHLPGVARVTRGAVFPVLEREHVSWARAVGLPARTILARELLPNVMSPVLVEFGVRLMWSVGTIASLSYLGYGIQPPTADWGEMISSNRSALGIQSLAVLAPIACVALFTIGGNLVSEGVSRVIARSEGRA